MNAELMKLVNNQAIVIVPPATESNWMTLCVKVKDDYYMVTPDVEVHDNSIWKRINNDSDTIRVYEISKEEMDRLSEMDDTALFAVMAILDKVQINEELVVRNLSSLAEDYALERLFVELDNIRLEELNEILSQEDTMTLKMKFQKYCIPKGYAD